MCNIYIYALYLASNIYKCYKKAVVSAYFFIHKGESVEKSIKIMLINYISLKKLEKPEKNYSDFNLIFL